MYLVIERGTISESNHPDVSYPADSSTKTQVVLLYVSTINSTIYDS